MIDHGVITTNSAEPPFEARVLANREVQVNSLQPLDCEHRRSYKLRLQAIGCAAGRTSNATLHVTVDDVNEHAPQFWQPAYNLRVHENAAPAVLVQLRATDRDCSPKYSEICRYELIGGDRADVPFEIDAIGQLRNTRPLTIEDGARHLLEVVAYDCGMRRSRPALVTIQLDTACQPYWTGDVLNQSDPLIEYLPMSGARVLVPDAELRLCDLSTTSSTSCDIANVTAEVSLDNDHISLGCDRDTYSVQSKRKLCGKYLFILRQSNTIFVRTAHSDCEHISSDCRSSQTHKFDQVKLHKYRIALLHCFPTFSS